MKYIAVLDTDDYEDFEFFEDGKEKYLHVVDANAENGEWIYLPFRPLEQEPIPYLMHKELDIPISECQKACDVAIEYLRSQGKLKG